MKTSAPAMVALLFALFSVAASANPLASKMMSALATSGHSSWRKLQVVSQACEDAVTALENNDIINATSEAKYEEEPACGTNLGDNGVVEVNCRIDYDTLAVHEEYAAACADTGGRLVPIGYSISCLDVDVTMAIVVNDEVCVPEACSDEDFKTEFEIGSEDELALEMEDGLGGNATCSVVTNVDGSANANINVPSSAETTPTNSAELMSQLDSIQTKLDTLLGQCGSGQPTRQRQLQDFDLDAFQWNIAGVDITSETAQELCPDAWAGYVSCVVTTCPNFMDVCPNYVGGPASAAVAKQGGESASTMCGELQEGFCTGIIGDDQDCCLLDCAESMHALHVCSITEMTGENLSDCPVPVCQGATSATDSTTNTQPQGQGQPTNNAGIKEQLDSIQMKLDNLLVQCGSSGGPQDQTDCYDTMGWMDADGDGCESYAQGAVLGYFSCDDADMYVDAEGVGAKEACCICGGGIAP